MEEMMAFIQEQSQVGGTMSFEQVLVANAVKCLPDHPLSAKKA